jgi:hypothetical protein
VKSTISLVAVIYPILFSCCAVAQSRQSLTTCEVESRVSEFDGKIVTVRATVVTGFGVFAIASAEKKCLLWLSYPGGGPEASVSVGELAPAISRPAVVLKEDSNFKRFSKLVDATMFSRDRGVIPALGPLNAHGSCPFRLINDL